MEEASTPLTKAPENASVAGSAASPTSNISRNRNARKRNRRRQAKKEMAEFLEQSVHNPAGTKVLKRFYLARNDSRGTAVEALADYAQRAEPPFRAGASKRERHRHIMFVGTIP